MSISGTFLVVITASFFKPLLSTNQSLQLPTIAVYDQYSNVLPFEDADMDSDGVTNLFLTLRLPKLFGNTMDSDLDMKRQFDPWGGKRLSKSLATDEDIGRKRQFSPWGGKRSLTGTSTFTKGDWTDADVQLKDLILPENKRGFNSWGGKRNSIAKYSKKGFNSWGGKRGFNSWGGKRNFNAWGGKRSENDPNEISNILSLIPKKNTNVGGKRQAFNSWGGKRAFNSWGGKRAFNSWGGKRANNLKPEAKELNTSDDNSIPSTYNAIIEGT